MKNLILCLTPTDIISIINILVTALVGIYIAHIVQKNLVVNRAVKDYFIKECQEIKSNYSKFFTDLDAQHLRADYVIRWFKIMTDKVENFESTVCYEYNIQLNLLAYHNKIKVFLTGSPVFNEQFSKTTCIKLDSQTFYEITEHHKVLSKIFTESIVKINRANLKYHRKNFLYKPKNWLLKTCQILRILNKRDKF